MRITGATISIVAVTLAVCSGFAKSADSDHNGMRIMMKMIGVL